MNLNVNQRIAVYIGNEMYPNNGNDPSSTIPILQQSPLTSPILSMINFSSTLGVLVYNDGVNPLYDNNGKYIGVDNWSGYITQLKNGGNIKEVYLSFSNSGLEWMADNLPAAAIIFSHIRNKLKFDGVDFDYEESDMSPSSPLYTVAAVAIKAGLLLTAAPYFGYDDWQAWVTYVQQQNGTVQWLNLQCYAGGKSNNPGEWLKIGVPIVAGSCSSCGGPQTNCSPADVQDLFTLWVTGKGSVSQNCWEGNPNTQPQLIGGGFMWVYAGIKNQYAAYMDAIQKGLGN